MSIHPLAPSLEAIPAHQLLGLRVDEMHDGVASVRLPWRDDLGNHIGSVHAAALFAIGDAASGAAMVSALGDLIATVTPIARGADIDYRKVARGDIVGRAEIPPEQVATIRAELADEGVSRPTVTIDMTDAQGVVVAVATFRWHVKVNG